MYVTSVCSLLLICWYCSYLLRWKDILEGILWSLIFLYAKEIHPSTAPVCSLMLVYETIVASIMVYVGLAWLSLSGSSAVPYCLHLLLPWPWLIGTCLVKYGCVVDQTVGQYQHQKAADNGASCWVNEVIGRNQILKNSIYKFWRVLWRGGDLLHPQFPTMLLFCCWVGVGDVGFFSLHFFFSSLELCCKSHCTQHWPILKHGCMSSLLWNDKRRTSTGLFTVLLPSAALVCYLNIGPYIYL